MDKRDPQIEKLAEILEKSLKRLDLSGRLEEYGIWPIWNETVGPTIARNAQPEKIRHGTLFIKVSSPVWMQQLQYMKEEIGERLNQNLRKKVVKNIFFFIGKIDAAPFPVENAPAASTSHSEAKLDEESLGSVKDADIRRAFKRLFAAHTRKGKKS
jgi:predicted nucleic acid-binding Zn ribbon protein